MVCWSSLPSEIKHHVVKKLDFMSRHALRNTSRLDREIVDSTKCIVPRVRFGYKEGKGLIVVYTGIDKFLRLEMENFEGGVIVKRSEDSFNLSRFQSKSIPTSMEVLEYGIFILKSLIAHNSIQIKALEWNVPKPSDSPPKRSFFMQTIDLLGASKIYVNELVRVGDTYVNKIEEKEMMKYWKDVRLFRDLGMLLSRNGFKTESIHDEEQRTNGRRKVKTTINLDNTVSGKKLVYTAIELIRRDTSKITDPCFTTVRESQRGRYHSRSFNRVHEKNYTVFNCSSQCGTWQHKMFKKDEKFFKKALLNEKCGVGVLCPKCADPFEYWFYQTFPRRMILEKEWCVGVTSNITMGNDWAAVMEIHKAIDRDIREELNKKDFKKEVASWGFKRVNESDSEEDSEEEKEEEEEEEEMDVNLMKKMMKPTRKTQKMESEKEEKVKEIPIQEIPIIPETTRNIPYYMIIAILPVFLSFIVYFYYPILF